MAISFAFWVRSVGPTRVLMCSNSDKSVLVFVVKHPLAILQCNNDTMLQYYNVTMLQCYNVKMLQCYNVTMFQCYNITMLQY